MSRSTVRRLFVVVFVALVVQYGLVGLVGVYASEPWPAIVLPGFKSVYATGDRFHVETPSIDVVFATEGRDRVSPSRFLDPLPRSHHPSFLSAQCRPVSLSGTMETEACRKPGGQQWFVDRARALYPDRSVRAVEVVWGGLYFDPGTRRVATAPLDTLRLSPMTGSY